MNLRELRRELQRLDRGDIAAVRHLLRRARPALGARWLDQVARDQLAQLAELAGEPISLAPIKDLECGETWLLLATGDGVGDVARGVVRPWAQCRRPLAHSAVERALAGLAATATNAGRSLRFEWISAGLEVPGDPGVAIEGSSLGLAVCVAACAAVTGRSPLSTVAGSAAVDPSGGLRKVSFLEQKCAALQRLWPHVATLVVAEEQELPNAVGGLNFLRAKTLREALVLFGLEVGGLPRPSKGDLRKRLVEIEEEEQRHHESSRWFALAIEAWEISRSLQTLVEDEADDARLLAALLSSHAGANDLAVERAQQVVSADSDRQATKHIYLGSFQIEIDPQRAVEDAEQGLRLAEVLPVARHRAKLVGRAHGTLGRALIARARFEEAEQHLKRGLEHHLDGDDHEAARSACYLACCHRMGGHADRALEIAEQALGWARQHAEVSESSRTSIPYALLERGRALAALGRFDEAVVDLQKVVATNTAEESYPALGGRRSLVTTFRRLGLRDEARDMLLACVRVARGTAFLTLRRVGGVAAMEELRAAEEDGREPLLPRSDLESAWKACFEAASADDVLRTWVY